MIELYTTVAFCDEKIGIYYTEKMTPASAPGELVLLMDPPRAGATERFLAAAATLAPARIVYVSCNPATQARDARTLAAHGYRITRVQPVDMFPHTPHIENICLFERRPGCSA